MIRIKEDSRHQERMIGSLLWYGTLLASAIIAAGMLLGALQRFGLDFGIETTGENVVKTGIAVFIVLPIARVALMLCSFLRERDYTFVAISVAVLAVIAGGVAIGL